MIHFNPTNHNMFYFNKTDITNGYLYIQDQISFVYKTILYLCKVNYNVDEDNNQAYNEILNTRYIRLQQQDLSSNSHSLTLVQQQDNDVKNVVVTFENKKNKIDLRELVYNNIIKDDQIWCILLRNYTESNRQESDVSVNNQSIKIFSFNNDNLNEQNKLVLNYSDLGVNKDVEIIIQDSDGIVVENPNFVNYKWENSYLNVQFYNSIDGVWRLKYLVDDNIKNNLKSVIKNLSIILDGTNYQKDDYTVQQIDNLVKITHQTSDYAFGNVYNKNNEQVLIGINIIDKNTCSILFNQQIEKPSQVNKYTLLLVLTSYYIEVDQNNNGGDNATVQYFPATYVKLKQLQSERQNNIIDNYLTPSIIEYRQITIHHQVAARIYGNEFKLSYQNWNDNEIYVFLNNNPIRLDSDMYSVDRQYGKIFLNFECTAADNIMCTYNFDYFPSHVLHGFLQRAVSQINAGPVGTMSNYTLQNCPQYWDGLIADYAYTYCLDRLILDYDIWKGKLIFSISPQGLADGSDNIISQLQSQRSSAWQRINITINNPKFKAKQALAYPTQHYIDGISPFGRYPGMSGNGVTGGRFRGLVINRFGGSF